MERKKRELQPILNVLTELSDVEGEDEEVAVFKHAMEEITDFTQIADKMLDKVIKTDKEWVLNSLVKMLGK